jgi:hypothetical protein
MNEEWVLGNCDVDFFIFREWKVWNFQNLKESKGDQNFAQKVEKILKQKQAAMKLNKSIILYHEVLFNIIKLFSQ